MSTETCGQEVTRRGEAEPCGRPVAGVVHYVFEGVQYTDPACDRHAMSFPLSDALAKHGQWMPCVGSFLMARVTA